MHLDVSRVDFRLDMHDNWKPYILEINPLPGLSVGISDIVIEAQADGIGHTELVNLILDTALERYGMKKIIQKIISKSDSEKFSIAFLL